MALHYFCDSTNSAGQLKQPNSWEHGLGLDNDRFQVCSIQVKTFVSGCFVVVNLYLIMVYLICLMTFCFQCNIFL